MGAAETAGSHGWEGLNLVTHSKRFGDERLATFTPSTLSSGCLLLPRRPEGRVLHYA